MSNSGSEAIAEALLSGMLKWERRRVQEYEQAMARDPEASDELRVAGQLDTFFLLKRALLPGFYQVACREVARDKRWDVQRHELLKDVLRSVASPTGTFAPRHFARSSGSGVSRPHAPRSAQRRYHEYFPEVFFDPGTPEATRHTDDRFLVLSTVFSPLDLPGEAPDRSPFVVHDLTGVATIRFKWAAQIIVGTEEFARDLVEARDAFTMALSELRLERGHDRATLETLERLLSTYGPVMQGFRAQIAAIASTQWFRRQDPETRDRLVREYVPLDAESMRRDRVLPLYAELGVASETVQRIIDRAALARRVTEDWLRFEARLQPSPTDDST